MFFFAKILVKKEGLNAPLQPPAWKKPQLPAKRLISF